MRLRGARAWGARARTVVLRCDLAVVCQWCVWTDPFFAGVADHTPTPKGRRTPTARVCHRTHHTVTSLLLTDRGELTDPRISGFIAQRGLPVPLSNSRPWDQDLDVDKKRSANVHRNTWKNTLLQKTCKKCEVQPNPIPKKKIRAEISTTRFAVALRIASTTGYRHISLFRRDRSLSTATAMRTASCSWRQ